MVRDAVPLSRYPIFASPCKFLRKVRFMNAMGKQTWRATEEHKARGDADWKDFTKGLVFSDGAARAPNASLRSARSAYWT
jgi:hypothetical protein